MNATPARRSSRAVLRHALYAALAALSAAAAMPHAADAGGWIRLLAPGGKGHAASVALDFGNNMYVCGPASQVGGESVSDGVNNIVVAKYGPDGRRLWQNRFGDGRRDECADLALDADGNVYAAAVALDDKGPKAVVMRYSPSGEAAGYGEYGIGTADAVAGIAPDRQGNMYIAGYGAPDGVAGKEAFVAKYDFAGKQVWRRAIPKPVESRAEGHAVAADDSGVYVTGWVGVAAGVARNGFIAKYSAAGYFGWMKIISGKGDVEGNAVAISPLGELLVAGSATGDLRGSQAFGRTDAFLARYSKNGDAGWAGLFGAADHDQGYGAAFDDGGGMYVGGASGLALKGSGKDDTFELFLARYMPDGVHDAPKAAEIPFTAPGGLVPPVFSGRITLNTGNRISIYGTLPENYLGRETDGHWSVRRWMAGPEAAAEEKPGEAAKGEHLASFKMEKKTFLTRDADEVGPAHNIFGKTVIVAGSVLALAGLLLLL